MFRSFDIQVITMDSKKLFLILVIVVAVVAIGAALIATMAGAAGPAYAVKVLASDKSESGKVFEGIVTEQTKGKTNILGDKINVRILGTTTARNKNNKKQKTTSWLGALQNGDYVTVQGGYRSGDKTIEASKVVNRSR